MTVSVYSARPHLVGLTLYTVTETRTTISAYSMLRLIVRYPQSTKIQPLSAVN